MLTLSSFPLCCLYVWWLILFLLFLCMLCVRLLSIYGWYLLFWSLSFMFWSSWALPWPDVGHAFRFNISLSLGLYEMLGDILPIVPGVYISYNLDSWSFFNLSRASNIFCYRITITSPLCAHFVLEVQRRRNKLAVEVISFPRRV